MGKWWVRDTEMVGAPRAGEVVSNRRQAIARRTRRKRINWSARHPFAEVKRYA
jgi:hypothetical protein